MKWTGEKIGLALGGGGVRGLAHIGVLNVLEQEGIGVDLIVGTSAGALIGGAYASGMSIRNITAKVDGYLRSSEYKDSAIKAIGTTFSSERKNFFQKTQTFLRNRYYLVRALFSPSILPSEDFQSLINYLLPDIDIKDTRIPFMAVTTDLISGKQVVLTEGSLRKAVLASSSVPGAVEPTRIGEWLLADGGVTSLVPVNAARKAGADVVIAVMVDRELPKETDIETAKDVLYRAGEITANMLEAAELENADVVIRPSVGDLHWADFSRSDHLIRVGEEATRQSLEAINNSLPLLRRFERFARRFRTIGKTDHKPDIRQ
ncbi:MAG: Patatin [Deltaproteobacteria bacterium]|nr:Patatin [Deltaproteobacteria bacterium]